MGPLLRMQTRLHFEDLPENVLPQWQQKIADAENIDRPNYSHFGAERIFRTKCDFLQVLDLLIFRQVARLLMPVPLPFSPYFAHRKHGKHRKGAVKRDKIREFGEFCVTLNVRVRRRTILRKKLCVDVRR